MSGNKNQQDVWPGAFDLDGTVPRRPPQTLETTQSISAAYAKRRISPAILGIGAILSAIFIGGIVLWMLCVKHPELYMPEDTTAEPLVTDEEIASVRTALRGAPRILPPILPELGRDAVGFVRDVRIVQILHPHICLASVTTGVSCDHPSELGQDNLVILQGYPTSKHVDGDEIGYFMPVKVIGRESYEAAIGGTRTVWSLVWIYQAFSEKEPPVRHR